MFSYIIHSKSFPIFCSLDVLSPLPAYSLPGFLFVFRGFFASSDLYPFLIYHMFQFLYNLKMLSLNFRILSLSSFQESNSLFWVLIFLDFVAQWLDPFARFPLTCLVTSSCHKPTFAINPWLFFLYHLPSKSYFPITSLWCFLFLWAPMNRIRLHPSFMPFTPKLYSPNCLSSTFLPWLFLWLLPNYCCL